MRTNLIMKLLVAFILLLNFLSCEKQLKPEDIEVSQINSTGFENIAQFSSLASFMSAATKFDNDGTIPIELRNIKTLKSATTLKSSSEYEIEEDTIVDSDLLCHFLNNEREIIIDDILFKITEKGTFFTKTDNANALYNSVLDEDILEHCFRVSIALGYPSLNNDLYAVEKYEKVYFFDTFNQKQSYYTPTVAQHSTLKSVTGRPTEDEWIDVDIDGKTGNNLWGFKYERHLHWDKTHRLNVKFYALNYGFRREMGIKTKSQKRGWTGIWRKRDAEKIINGWEVLNFQEKWDDYFFGPNFNPNETHQPRISNYPNSWTDLDYGYSNYAKKEWKTINLMGADIEFSQKDKLGALWNACKSAGKTLVDFLDNNFSNPASAKDAIRIIPKDIRTKRTKISLAPFEEKKLHDNKLTTIFTSNTGFEIGFKSNTPGQFGFPGIETFAGNASIIDGTILYSAGRYDGEWKAIRITFK